MMDSSLSDSWDRSTTTRLGQPQQRVRISLPIESDIPIHTRYIQRTLNWEFNQRGKVAILGASGYTGAELTRLILNHPDLKIEVLTGDRNAASRSSVKIVDLSADFRLRDPAVYQKWYDKPHAAVKLQEEAVYGLTELNRENVRKARLLANPGCYPTAAQLPLIPLLRAGLISSEDIIIDAKSGATGAGRGAKESSLFCEVTEGIHAYSIASHRHAPEIEQGLGDATGKDVVINFTPHLMPMTRGILESIYVKLTPGRSVSDLKAELERIYANEAFVHVLEGKAVPQTRHVKGSNHVFINVFADRLPGRAIIISAIDNVVKGASGQALQNMNLMLGFEETTGLTNAPLFP
eukprot:scaffold44_cov172-Ochromonas_danica.AAC.3